eukprot:scaffold8419_cov62-Attheya_sp.AAC.17
MRVIACLLSVVVGTTRVGAFSVQTTPQKSTVSKSPIFETLKFDGAPTFDVLAKTREHVELQMSTGGKVPEEMYAKDYVLRGAVIGPLTRKDLTDTQAGFDLLTAFDTNIDTFGYTIDPENPYRCFYFQRWRAVHNGPLQLGGRTIDATQNEMEAPVSTFSVVWTPEQKIIYEQVGSVVDRFEGNTAGKAAVFGLLHTAGVSLPGGPGSHTFRFLQRLGHVFKNGRSFSEEEDIPSWWTSKSRGADPTDQF